jgi:heptosyltransferase-1
MPDILFIKTSSLGDVIHHMPAVTDARRHLPDAHVSWVVEEAFAPLARLHPGVDTVISVSVRRLKHSPMAWSAWRDMRTFIAALRARKYDAVIDTQGLLRTGVLSRLARGRRHGYDRDSVRERPATTFYQVAHSVPRDLHAIARNRTLTGVALGYTPEGPPDFGLDRAKLAGVARAPYAILLHATAQRQKEWPVENWRALANTLSQEINLLVPYGSEVERQRSEAIADGIDRTLVPMRRSIDQMAEMIAGASFVVGVDTGILHLAAALGVPLVAIFCGSKPALTGPMGSGPMEVLGSQGATPSVEEVLAAVRRIAPDASAGRAPAPTNWQQE